LCFVHNANFLSAKTRVSGVFCDTVYRHYQSILFFQTLPWYTCKCDLIFSHRKCTALPVPIFTMLIIIQYTCVEMCTKFFSPHQLKNVENMGKIAFTAPIFTKHITTSGIMWRSPTSSYTSIGQEIWKLQVVIHLHLYIKYNSYSANFHSCLTTFCRELYKSSWKSSKWFSCW
jgi:hypothetical protein